MLVVGAGVKIAGYARTPAPLKIPTTPAPTSPSGVAAHDARGRVLREPVQGQQVDLAFSWMFHAALLLVLLRHLRYFQEPVWTPVVAVQFIGTYAAFAMVAGLAGLWAARARRPRAHISTPSDHLHLALLLAIGLTGLAMRFVRHTDIVAVKTFMLGLMRFEIHPLPADPVLLLHLTSSRC